MSQPLQTDAAVDLRTTYMGLALAHPFVAGASPIAETLDGIRRLEDGGAAAIVLHSLFEEQITEAASGRVHGIDRFDDPALASRVAAFPAAESYPLTPDAYLEHLRKAKAAASVPIIASLNGTAAGSWLREARLLQDAGADAVELNFYAIVSDMKVSSSAIESSIISAVTELKRALRIPVAVKLPPFFTAFANLAHQLDGVGVGALVMFNRFYQPDIDLTTMRVAPRLALSTDQELLLRLRWLALLSGRVRASLAVTGGVEGWDGGAKAILAGAHVVQMTSAVLRRGPTVFREAGTGLAHWMTERGLASVDAMRGLCRLEANDSMVDERASYIRLLQGWKR